MAIPDIKTQGKHRAWFFSQSTNYIFQMFSLVLLARYKLIMSFHSIYLNGFNVYYIALIEVLK